MTNPAIVYAEQGKFGQAEPLFRQVVDIQRRGSGPEHPDTLESMSNLAGFRRDTGKYAQAEALCSETLEIRRRVLGPEDRSTLLSMYWQADAYLCAGQMVSSRCAMFSRIHQRHLPAVGYPGDSREMLHSA